MENSVPPSVNDTSSVETHKITQERKRSIIIIEHLPISSFPDAFSLSHPCLHNESDAMVTVAKKQASQMLLILALLTVSCDEVGEDEKGKKHG